MNFSFFRSNPFSTFQLFNLRMIIAKPQLHVVRDGIVSIEFSTNSSAFGVNERAVKRDRVQKWPKGWTLSTDIRYMAWCVGFDSKLKHVLVHKVYNFVTRKRWAHHMGLRSKKIRFFFQRNSQEERSICCMENGWWHHIYCRQRSLHEWCYSFAA